MKATVELCGMEFHAFHGCLEEERTQGNRFTVDVTYEYEASEAVAEDNLCKAIDYSKIYDIVALEMKLPSDLLENVAFRIRNAILSEIPGIESLRVTVSKQRPPVGGPCEWSKVTI